MLTRKSVFGIFWLWFGLSQPISAQQCGWDFWNVFVLGFSEAAGWNGKPEMTLMEVRFGDTVQVENQLEVLSGKDWLRSKAERNPFRNLTFVRYPDLYHLFFSSRPGPSMYLLRVRGRKSGLGRATEYYPLFSEEACHMCSFLRSQEVESVELRPFRAVLADVPRMPEMEEGTHFRKSPVWLDPVYQRVSEKGKLPQRCELVGVRARREGLVLQEFQFEGCPPVDIGSDLPIQMGYFSMDRNRPEKDFSVLRKREINALTRQQESFRDFYFFVHSTQTYVKDDVLSVVADVWYAPEEDVFYRKEIRREGDRLWRYRRGFDRNWVFVSGEKPRVEVSPTPANQSPRNCWMQKLESPRGYLPVQLPDSGLTVRDTFYLWSLVDKPLSMKEFYADNPNLFKLPAYAMPGEWTPVYYEETLSPTETAFTWNTRQLRIESEGCSSLFLGLQFLQAGKKVEERKSEQGYTWLGPVLPDSTREILYGNRFRYPIRKGSVHLRNGEPVNRWDQHLQTEEPPGFLYKTRFLTLICDSLSGQEKSLLQFFARDGKGWKPALAGFSGGEPGVHLQPEVDSLLVRLGKRECRFRIETVQKMGESKMYLPPLLLPEESYLLMNGFREPFYWLEDKWTLWVKGAGQHMPERKPEPGPGKRVPDLTLQAVRIRYQEKYPKLRLSVNLWAGMLYADIRDLSENEQKRLFRDWEADADVKLVCPQFVGKRIPVFSGGCLFKVPNPEVGMAVRKEAELFGFEFAGLAMDGTVQMQWIKSKRLEMDFFNAYQHLLKVPGVISGILDGVRVTVVEQRD